MMVTASLTAFAFSWRSVLAALQGMKQSSATEAQTDVITDDVPRKVHLNLIIVFSLLAVVLQFTLFGIGWGLATFSVLLTFLLAIVAARVSGETGITPVGAMGKVTQLTFGVIESGNVSANLMAANVTGGAVVNADLLHDMKTGLIIGASLANKPTGN